MKLRNAGLLALVLAATASCKKSENRAQPTGPSVAPVTTSGSDAAITATANDPWAKPDEKKDPVKKPLFWQLEKDGKTTYILGTMHLGVDAELRLPEVVWKRFDEAKVFAMETDLTDAESKLPIRRTDGKTLKDEIGEAHWKKLEEVLGKPTADQLLPMKPMIPATLLAMRGLPPTPPMDKVLHARAQQQNKQIVFLETLEHEAAVLEKWMNARALKDMLDDLPGGEQRTKDMLAAYLAGDEGRILAINEDERKAWLKRGRTQKEYDEQMEDLLYKRNASWIAPIEKTHAQGPAFIAMGAMHAVGPRSVLELLEKKGYKITRVTP